MNGRQNQLVHKLETDIDLKSGAVKIGIHGTDDQFTCNLTDISDNAEFERWLSEFFGEPITMERAAKSNFTESTGGLVPYRISATGPIIVSSKTLNEIASWYDNLHLEDIRRRLRTNFEIRGGGAFWEDRLFTDSEHAVEFTVGDVTHHGVMSKPRCVTPSRDPDTGELNEHFSKIFVENRRESFPDRADADNLGIHIEHDFDHYYYLTVVTRIPGYESGKRISVGDELTITGETPLLKTI